MRERVLQHLRELVALRTPNPPRAIDADHPIFAYLKSALGDGFEHTLQDHGDGCVSLFSVRGAPRTLFNFHIDTVPAVPGYSADPWTLRVEDGRAIGLGACDIKGASAAMLAAAAEADGPAALLFTSDEEHGRSTCVRAFCERGLQDFGLVVVAEPTQGRAVTEHRGIFTGSATFHGTPGHASSGRADLDSAVHHAVRWAGRALDLAARHASDRHGALRGIPLNLGRIEGGVKPNMIADHAEIRFGFRTLPGADGGEFFTALAGLTDADSEFVPGFVAPALPAVGRTADVARAGAAKLGLPAGDAVDFWTEAALFSEAGYAVVVFGPGDIAQAHTADEWVALAQLDEVAAAYRGMLEGGR